MNLQSYVCGAWRSGRDPGVAMRDATTGEVVAHGILHGHRLHRRRSNMPAAWADRHFAR